MNRPRYSNQDGMVLVLVLIVLLASTLIGVAAIRGVTTDIRIVGNDARFSQSLYQAEADINTTLCETRLWVDAPADYPTSTCVNKGKSIEISSQGRGQPPRGSGYSVTSFEAGYYDIKAVEGNAQVIAGAWMLFPKVK